MTVNILKYLFRAADAPDCIERRTNQWILRIRQEERKCSSSYFVTLTYSTDHVPISKNGFLTLEKTDIQKFFKRLRKIHVGLPIRYYLVGEYGGLRKRPHYHALILNADPAQIKETWKQGDVHFGTVTSNSIAYTCKYMAKSYVHRKSHDRDDRKAEFSLMSKGLGKDYVEKRRSWHLADPNRNYAIIEGGIKVPLPRYFREMLYSEDIRKKQAQTAQKLSEERYEHEWSIFAFRTGDRSLEAFEAFREQCLRAKLETYYKNSEQNRKKNL